MKTKRRKIMARKARRGEEEEKFNIQFWKEVPGERKLEIAWEMVSDFYLIRGKEDAFQPRLQRTVENIIRRRG